jgi:pSer/pThr/pTyr-binding forkhead associated (FHA) protein
MTGIVILILRIFLAVSLYGFLVWALYTLWRELKASQMLSVQKVPSISIRLVEPEDSLAQLFSVSQVIVGRDPTCEICLPNELVSSQHAKFSYHHNQWWVEDLHSTNGTFLNDERVSTPTVLIADDEVRCGRNNLLIGFNDQALLKS